MLLQLDNFLGAPGEISYQIPKQYTCVSMETSQIKIFTVIRYCYVIHFHIEDFFWLSKDSISLLSILSLFFLSHSVIVEQLTSL